MRGILTRLSNDSVEDRGKHNQASGDRLVANGEFDKAFAVYMISAKEGYAPCQNSIGYAYDHGEGVKQDAREAVRWYKLAADQNHGGGQYNLGISYMLGTGVNKNHDEAMKYINKAANNNHPLALFDLGCFSDSNGMHQKAYGYFKLSAELGHPQAQHNLAICYLNGEGTERNENQALYWFRLAAQNGVEDSIAILRANGLL